MTHAFRGEDDALGVADRGLPLPPLLQVKVPKLYRRETMALEKGKAGAEP